MYSYMYGLNFKAMYALTVHNQCCYLWLNYNIIIVTVAVIHSGFSICGDTDQNFQVLIILVMSLNDPP